MNPFSVKAVSVGWKAASMPNAPQRSCAQAVNCGNRRSDRVYWHLPRAARHQAGLAAKVRLALRWMALHSPEFCIFSPSSFGSAVYRS
jgi:hypothetical protein